MKIWPDSKKLKLILDGCDRLVDYVPCCTALTDGYNLWVFGSSLIEKKHLSQIWPLKEPTSLQQHWLPVNWKFSILQSTEHVPQSSKLCCSCSETLSLFLQSNIPTQLLHWLPVSIRIKYKIKICLVTYMTYLTLCNNHLIYLKEMPKTPNRTHGGFRSSDHNLLFVLRIKTGKGEGSFVCGAPTLSNWLYPSVKHYNVSSCSTIQEKMKTFLFCPSFSYHNIEWNKDYNTESFFWLLCIWVRDTGELGVIWF